MYNMLSFRFKNKSPKTKMIIKRLLVFLLTLFLCVPGFTSFAATEDSYQAEIDEYQAYLREVADQCTDADAKQKFEKLIEILFSDEVKSKFTSNDENYKTIKSGYTIIKDTVRDTCGLNAWDAFFGSDLNAWNLTKQWQSKFRTDAEQLGIEYGNVFNNRGDDQDEVQNASVKVNILTWNRDQNTSGASINNNERGVISNFLRSFDGFSVFTGIVSSIAVALTIAFGCSNLLMMTSDRNLSDEALIREFGKMLFGIWFIFNYKFFALLVIRLGTIVTEKVLIADFTSNRGLIVYKCLCQSIVELVEEKGNIFNLTTFTTTGSAGTGEGIGNVISNGLSIVTSFVGGGITQLASSLVIYSIVVEIGVRYLFTPLAIADLYSEKFRSNGWMWIKKLFACALQGAVVYAIIFATHALKNSFISTDITTVTAINLTMIGMFAKSRQIANDIIGVH